MVLIKKVLIVTVFGSEVVVGRKTTDVGLIERCLERRAISAETIWRFKGRPKRQKVDD